MPRAGRTPHDPAGAFGAGRSTAQRRTIASAVSRLGGAFTADELASLVRGESSGVSTATVYRSISSMVTSGHLSPVGEREGAILYARCGKTGHHHHVVCTGCGATVHAPCPVDQAELAAAVPDGFVVTSHEISLYGLCAACGARERGADGGLGADGCSCAADADADAHAGTSAPPAVERG